MQRILGFDLARARSTLSRSDDDREARAAQAELVDRTGAPERSFVHASRPRILRDPGMRLERSLRRALEDRLAAPFGSVRIHTGATASAAAAALDARAFTIGEDIVFGAGAFAPDTATGRRLLRHELLHVTQQRQGGLTIDRQPKPAPADSGAVPLPQPPTTTPDGYDVPIEVEAPRIGGEGVEKQTFMLHVKKEGEPEHAKFFAVPITKLRLPKADPAKAAPAPATAPAPTTAPGPTGAPSASAPPPQHPAIPPGTVVTTVDGVKLTAVSSTPEHIITAEYNKYAVGAASTSALKLADGTFVVIDSGVNAKGLGTTMEALKQATLGKLDAFIKDGVIREYLSSHIHSDHASLGPDIMRRHPIDTIRINSVQARSEAGKEFRKAMVEAQQQRVKAVEAAFKERMQAERVAWEKGEGAAYAPDARQAEWEKYVKRQFEEKKAGIPEARTARERLLIQSKRNVLDVADVDLATGEKRGVKPLDPNRPPGSPEFAVEDPYASIRETQAPIKSKRILDQRRKTKAGDIDPNASAYLVQVSGGMRLLVLPDLRANDLQRIMQNFVNAMDSLKKAKPGTHAVTVQIWDATHHMQKGWYAGAVPARQFAKIVDFLHAFSLKQGHDAVVVSAQADLSRPGSGTLVDPANLWLLRSLGFEAYVATSGRDVRVIDITTSQGTKLTGIIGDKAPGEGPKELTIKRAKLAMDQLAAERQSLRVALKEETDKAKQEAIKERMAEVDGLQKEIRTAYNESLQEIDTNFKKASRTAKDLTDPVKKDFPKQRALDLLLEKHNFDRPVMMDARLTEMALVVLNIDPAAPPPEPGTPAARARELAQVRSKLVELDARIKAGEMSPEVQAERIVELNRYRLILDNELNPKDPAQKPIEGVSRQLLTDDLKSVEGKIEALTQKKETSVTRKLASGEVIEQHAYTVRPLKPPESKTLTAAKGVAEVAGRGMGVVMVVTTVTGQGDLMRRWQEGQATNAEIAVGTARNVTSGAVGLLMATGKHVHPGVFVIMAALEVGEAALREYKTEEEHDIAVAEAAVSAAINLGCMGVGMALMAIPNPITFIAGFLLTFAGPLVMRLLGVHDWLEKKLSFNPPQVVEVLQVLRKLLQEYRLIVGAIQVAKRAGDLTDPTVTNREAAKAEAQKIINQETLRAVQLEVKILNEFEEAYKDAKTNYAGLTDLDTYRAQFYMLRHQAGVAERAAPFAHIIKLRDPDEVFRKIDANMSIDDLSEDQIRAMPQWKRLDKELPELGELIGADRDERYHDKIRDKDKRVQAMIDNARYRLDPKVQGEQRAKPILSPGTWGRRVYEKELLHYETELASQRFRYVERTKALCGISLVPKGADPNDALRAFKWPINLEWALSMAEGSVNAYEATVRTMFAPSGELASALFTASAAAERYRKFVKDNGHYAGELQRLETTERMIEGQFSQARRMVGAVAEGGAESDKLNRQRLTDADKKMKSAKSLRFFKRGIVYLSELDDLQRQVWQEEVKQVSPLFGDKDRKIKPLTDEELFVLKEKEEEFNANDRVIPPLDWRLSITRSPLERDSSGNLANIFRLTGQVQLYAGATAVLPTPVHVFPKQNAMVGVHGSATTGYGRLKVVPLTDKAIEIFKGVRIYDVPTQNLAPVPYAELQKVREEQPLKPAAQPSGTVTVTSVLP